MKATSSSTRSLLRAPAESERGYVLVTVLVLAVLYFTLITLILWESSMRYRAAQRFRSRVVAQNLAENAAELAAMSVADASSVTMNATIGDGTMKATGTVTEGVDGVRFRIDAEGETKGVQAASATVTVWGRVDANELSITRTLHSQ